MSRTGAVNSFTASFCLNLWRFLEARGRPFLPLDLGPRRRLNPDCTISSRTPTTTKAPMNTSAPLEDDWLPKLRWPPWGFCARTALREDFEWQTRN